MMFGMRFKIGFSTQAYKRLSIEEALTRIRALGFDWVEICADGGHLDPRLFTIEQASEIRSFLDELDLKLYSYHAPYSGVDLASRDVSKREESVNLMKRAIDYSVALNCPAMVLHVNSGESLECLTREKMILNTIASVRKIAYYAESCGAKIKIALENLMDHDRNRFGSRVSDLKLIIQRTGSSLLGICLDTGHSNLIKERGFKPTEEIERCGHLFSTHIHDNDGEEDSHQPLGCGIIDWRTFFEILNRTNPEVGLIHEVEGSLNPDQIVRQCIDNMKRFI